MNPFLNPPDRSTRRVIDIETNSPGTLHPEPPAPLAPPARNGLLPAPAALPWPPPTSAAAPSPVPAGHRSGRWPISPLQRSTAALLALLVLGALAVVAGLPTADSGDVLDGLGTYVTVIGLAAAGAVVSVVASGRSSSPLGADGTDALAFRIVFGALAALIFVVVLQSDTQNVVNADGQTAHLWAVIGGFVERLARPFVAGSPGSTPDR